jgi:protein-disulfide isomerase
MPQCIRHALGTCAVLLAFLAYPAGPASAQEFTPEQKAEIESMIGDYISRNPEFIADYLRQNPEILLEVSDILRARKIAQERQTAAFTLEAHRDRIERHPMTPSTGNANGDVTVVEFFDYQCPYCKRVFSYMMELEKEDRNLRVVWKEFPVLKPPSYFAAVAAMAADRQGKYMEYHRAVMGAKGRLTEARILDLAEGAGLDIGQLKIDMKDPEIKAYLEETKRLAEALGINGTPGFVVGDEVIGGAIDKANMKLYIRSAREKGS